MQIECYNNTKMNQLIQNINNGKLKYLWAKMIWEKIVIKPY